MTPNLEVVVDYAKAEYGLHVGIYKCRRIAGSQAYSQHSWRNAADIYTTSRKRQDAIAADLKEKFGSHIRNVLTWRYNSDHWNHVHVDMWPRGLYTPPCAGGSLRVKHEDGTRGTVFTSDLEGVEIVASMQVEDLQEALNDAGQLGADGRPLNVDGIWGPNSHYAIVGGFTALEAKAGLTEDEVNALIAQTTLVPGGPR